MGTVVTYSRKAHGEQSLSANFRVREFACKDGSDKILVDTNLVALLQKIRDHFGAAVTINSAYRTPAHNKAVAALPAASTSKARRQTSWWRERRPWRWRSTPNT